MFGFLIFALFFMLPKQFEKYFWDVDFEKLDEKKHKQYVVARLLEHGDLESVRWLLKKYQNRTIKKVLMKSREFTEKTANFWANYFGLNKNNILCLRKSYLKRRRELWPY